MPEPEPDIEHTARDSESIREHHAHDRESSAAELGLEGAAVEVRSSSKSTHTTASQYRIPTPSELVGSSTLRGPPLVDLHHPLVLHFVVPDPDDLAAVQNASFGDTTSVGTSFSRGRSSLKEFKKRQQLALANSDVQTRFREVLFRFQSEEMGHMEMVDREGRVIAFVENGIVTFGEERCKVKHFVRTKVAGNTGKIIMHDNHPYEWIQEQFYGIVRTTPGAERAAIIYDSNDPPAVELVEDATRIGGLTERILFAYVLLHSGICSGRGKSRARDQRPDSSGGIMKRWFGNMPFSRSVAGSV